MGIGIHDRGVGQVMLGGGTDRKRRPGKVRGEGQDRPSIGREDHPSHVEREGTLSEPPRIDDVDVLARGAGEELRLEDEMVRISEEEPVTRV